MKRFKAICSISVFAALSIAMASCDSAKVSCTIDNKTAYFEVSTFTPSEYLKKNHASFTSINEDTARIEVAISNAKEGSSYCLYINENHSLNASEIKASSFPNTKFEATRYSSNVDGRRYLLISYQEGSLTQYVGFAYGCPEADASFYQSIAGFPHETIKVERKVWNDGQFQTNKEYFFESKADVDSFFDTFGKATFLALDNNTVGAQKPGEDPLPYYAITLGKENPVVMSYDDHGIFHYAETRYGALDWEFQSWLTRANRQGQTFLFSLLCM